MTLKLLIGTTNRAKKKEIIKVLKNSKINQISFVSVNDLNIKDSPEETGKTICENADIKSKHYGNLTNLPTIGDDGAFTIPILNNQPGVRSRRWLGYQASDKELIDYTLKRLEKIPRTKRTAYLETCICFYNPQTKEKFFSQEKIKGYIAEKPTKDRIKGYPYRALFIVEKYNKYYDQLTDKEHNKINHRFKAIKK